MVAVGDTVFLVVDDGIHGPELWRTDGTQAGSTMVTDLRPGPDGSRIGFMYALGAELVFFADDLGTGYRMWRTNGSEEGTRLADDLVPFGYYRWPAVGADLNGILIFDDSLLQPHTGIYAGRTGETTTTFLSDVSGSRFVVDGDVAFFSGYRSLDGQSLWRSDGTPSGTSPLNPTAGRRLDSPRSLESTKSGRGRVDLGPVLRRRTSLERQPVVTCFAEEVRERQGSLRDCHAAGVNARRTRYSFTSPQPLGGAVDKVIVRRRTPTDQTLYVAIRGKKGTFAASPISLPLAATLVFAPRSPQREHARRLRSRA